MRKPSYAKEFKESDLESLKVTDSITKRDILISNLESRVTYILSLLWHYAKIPQSAYSWWSWEYYEDADMPAPSFNYRRNIVEQENPYVMLYSTPEAYFLYKGEEWGSAEGFPVEWLWAKDADKCIRESINDYNDFKEKIKEKESNKRDQLKEYQKKYRASAMKKLSSEEKWACGLSKRFPKSLKES